MGNYYKIPIKIARLKTSPKFSDENYHVIMEKFVSKKGTINMADGNRRKEIGIKQEGIMSFKSIPITNAYRLINHGPTVLITSRLGEKINVMTAAWQMPVSFKPMLVAVSIGHERFSHKLILEGREFVINIPHLEMIKEVLCCGTHSGKDKDKFDLCNLSPVKAQKVKIPLIKECIGNIECKLYVHYEAGDHTIFVGEVVAASVKEGIFDGHLKVELDEAKTLHHLGGKVFCHPNGIEIV
jgi:flavin reductase (DIM6/NTAB) family NADH-FMN oxidoreductase RutF